MQGRSWSWTSALVSIEIVSRELKAPTHGHGNQKSNTTRAKTSVCVEISDAAEM
jgi:hypothetical protein